MKTGSLASMRFFQLECLGDRYAMDVVVDRGPSGLGMRGLWLGEGKPFEDAYPSDLKVTLRESRPGRELTDVLSNTKWCLKANGRTREVIRTLCGDEGVEYLPFSLHEPDGTLLSADYAIVHPVRFCDVVNRDASEIDYEADDPEGEISSVETYVFDAARGIDLPHVFRVPEFSYDVFFDETLARALHDAKIGNLFLHEVEVR